MLSEIVGQADRAARLLERAAKACTNVRGLRSGDRVYTPLVASAEFSQGNAPSQNVVFNVPADADFWAYRLLLYPYCKVIDPVNGTPDEIVFRPTSFTGQPGSPGVKNPNTRYSDFNNIVDGVFALIRDGKELQNVDTPMSAAYCATMGKWLAVNAAATNHAGWGGTTQTPAGMEFDIPFFIPRSKTLTLRLTPTYLGIRTIVETITVEAAPVEIIRQHRYKIVAVLEGEKKVTAFR